MKLKSFNLKKISIVKKNYPKKSVCIVIPVVLLFMPFNVLSQNQDPKPRVIAMTDGEVDDRCSMVRFLLYTNDIELLAIIQTNSVYQKHGWVAEKWLDKQVDAYEKAYPNLVIHDPDYPKPDVLRSKLFVGDNDSHGRSHEQLPPGADRRRRTVHP